jgi:glucosylceramidase
MSLYPVFLRQVFNHWVSGWIDWNLALDTFGGPTYLENYLDAAIIINATANEFYKQPTFYAIAHLSKFVPPRSKRIQLTSTTDSGIDNVAFLRPDTLVTVVLLNR